MKRAPLRCRGDLLTVLTAITLLAVLAVLTPGAAQAQAVLGRLFNTQQERQAFDAQRAKSATGPASAAAQAPAGIPGLPVGVPGNMPAGMAGAMAGGTPAGIPGLPPGVPGNMPGGMPDPSATVQPGAAADNTGRMPYPTNPGPNGGNPENGAAQVAPAPEPEQLTMNGVLRTSSGRNTVWLNNVPQRGAANKFSNRNRQALTVTLPSGKRVVLQPGQRYDLADGRVKDISEP